MQAIDLQLVGDLPGATAEEREWRPGWRFHTPRHWHQILEVHLGPLVTRKYSRLFVIYNSHTSYLTFLDVVII